MFLKSNIGKILDKTKPRIVKQPGLNTVQLQGEAYFINPNPSRSDLLSG